MSNDIFKTIEQLAVEEFVREYDHIRRQLTAEQWPVVENAIRQMAYYAALTVNDPGRREQYQRDVQHLIGTIQSQTALAQMRVANAVIDTIGRVTTKALDILLAFARRAIVPV